MVVGLSVVNRQKKIWKKYKEQSYLAEIQKYFEWGCMGGFMGI